MTADSWVKHFRRQVKLGTTTGWGVRDRHGRIQLRVEGVGASTLPYEWSESGSIKALPRILQIFKRYTVEGLSLAKAASDVETSSSEQRVNWSALCDGFREQRPSTSDATWQKHYKPVLIAAEALMVGNAKKPRDGEELLLKALQRWEQGSRMRQISRRNLSAFLTWAVQRHHLKGCYLPPRHSPETLKPKRVGYPLSDADILRLLDDINDERWRFAVQLLAVYGLRPADLKFLRYRDGEVWSVYRKSQGGLKGAKTPPRKLHAFPVHGADDWKLALRLAAGEKLPPLGGDGMAGDALKTYLSRRKVWKELRAAAAELDEQLTPYSFRHRFAKETHRAGIPVADIAAAMGHSIEVHLSSYARFQPDGTAAAFAKAIKS